MPELVLPQRVLKTFLWCEQQPRELHEPLKLCGLLGAESQAQREGQVGPDSREGALGRQEGVGEAQQH